MDNQQELRIHRPAGALPPTADATAAQDVPFEWTLTPVARSAWTIVHQAMASADGARRLQTSSRARQPRHAETFKASIASIIANAAIHALNGGPGQIYVSRSKAELDRSDRYKPNHMTGAFPQRLDQLSASGWIKQHRSYARIGGSGKRSTIEAGPKLLRALHEQQISIRDFSHSRRDEPLLLKGAKSGSQRELIDYLETAETTRLRKQVVRINRALAEASISITPGYQDRVDLNNRQLHRTFIDGQFDRGGRFWGGFWMPMTKLDRFAALRIDGERLVELDFGQLFPRIAYSMVKAEPSSEDLYEIPGLEEVARRERKVMFGSLLWATNPVTRLPRGMRDLFPKHLNGRSVVALIKARHPALVPVLEQGLGARIMGIESEILARILLRLCDQGTTALPIHDALLTNLSSLQSVRRVMIEEYQAVIGTSPILTATFDPTLG